MHSKQHFHNILSIQSTSYDSTLMEGYIKRRIKKLGLTPVTDSYGNIYVTKGKGDLYPTMVCHIDTVHDINWNAKVIKQGDLWFSIDTKTMEFHGIGGDDKVGIYITLQLLEHFDNFKAVFFKDEEVGCVGSSQANFEFFNDSTIVLQCDRQGSKDFVNNISGIKLYDEALRNDIIAILNNYKRIETTGGMTDVQQIAKNNDVAVANMSCGYYNPHMNNEYINYYTVQQTTEMCANVFKATKHKRYTVDRKQPTSMYPYYNKYKTTNQPYNYQHHLNYSYDWDEIDYNKENAPKNHNHDGYCGSCGTTAEYDDTCDALWCYTCQTYTYIESFTM